MCDLHYHLLLTPEVPFVIFDGNGSISGLIYETFMKSFKFCCGKAPNVTISYVKNQEKMMRDIGNATIAMPVSLPSRMLQSDPGAFLRIVDSSGVAFIAQAPTIGERSLLLQGLTTIWPILLTVLLSCGYAALAFWLAEFACNPEKRQIARPFLLGFFDGYWFAFITATTVGYGDKVTGSRIGKLLTVFWLLIGLALLSSFTAAMTNLLSASQDLLNAAVTIKGKSRIGVMHGSMSRQVVIQFGIKPIESEDWDELTQMLLNDTVEGIVLNQYHCAYLRKTFPKQIEVEIEHMEPVSTGIVFTAPVGSEEARQCVHRYLFFRSLDFGNSFQDDLQEQQKSSRNDPRDSAMQALTSGVNMYNFYIMGGLLLALIMLVWLADFLITRKLKQSPNASAREESQSAEKEQATTPFI